MSLINEHNVFGGYYISKKDLLIYVIASQALLSVLQIMHYPILLTFDAGYNDR